MTWNCDKCGAYIDTIFHQCPYDYHLPYPSPYIKPTPYSSPYDNPLLYPNVPATCINCGQKIQLENGFLLYHECPKFYCEKCDVHFSGVHRCYRKNPEIEDIKNRLKNIEDLLREKLK
jgi:hypothetical protein